MTLDIDWSHFLELELWNLTDAICLACGSHPEDYQDAVFADVIEEMDRRIEGKKPGFGFSIPKRAQVALSAIEAGSLPSRSQTQSGIPRVNPREFAKWASKKGWDLPDELRSLVPATETGTPSLDNPKHKSTWLRLLGALCMKAEIDYTQPGADKKLETLTERYDVRVERKTIKSIIDELSDHVEWRDAPPS